MTIPGFMTVQQVAEEAGVSVDTVRRACRNKDIPNALRIGKSFLIPNKSFETWVKSGRRKMGYPKGRPRHRA